MIVVRTDNPDEEIRNLRDYYLINSNYAIFTVTEEINEEFIKEYFQHKIYNGKVLLLTPLLVLTKSDDVIDLLNEIFILEFIDGIESVIETSYTFIQSGFLPIDHDLITHYIKTNIKPYNLAFAILPNSSYSLTRDEYYVLRMFADLGYLKELIKNMFEPTDKMINTLEETKYAMQLIVLKNNIDASVLCNEKYIKALYEMLKLIDINIFYCVSQLEEC